MRLRSDIWVKAYLRSCAVAGLAGVVVRHGDDDAGAIFIKINRLDGTAVLFGPAPAGLDTGDLGRWFTPRLKGAVAPDASVEDALAQEVRFDPDLWIVEIESTTGVHHLNSWLSATLG
jgi:hypothetical protein